MRCLWWYLLPGLCAGIVVAAVPAWACSPVLVCATQAPFAAGTQLPASTKAIPLLVPQPMQAPFAPLVPELRDAAGKLQLTELVDDPGSGYKLLKPLKGLTANSAYTLVLPGFCQDSFGNVVPPKELAFTTGPGAIAPQLMGTLQLKAFAPELVSVWTSAGSCTVPIQAARGHATVALAPELQPWLPIARAELWVDGAKWAGGVYGDVPTQPAPAPLSKGRTVHEFFVPCGPVPAMADPGLLPGEHHVDVRVHVAGEYNDPAYLYGDLTVLCSGYVEADASGSDGTSGDTTAGNDASGLDSDAGKGPTPNAAPDSDGSCSSGRSALAGPWLAALVCAVVTALRRRTWPTASEAKK